MDILSQVAETIKRHQLLRAEEAVIVAVSGGADSLCLAWVLRQLGYLITIAHFDHGLRPESGQEASFVEGLAEQWEVPFHLEQADPPAQPGRSQEAWARQARYRYFLRIATKVGIDKVATGHTADDQVETILMNLIRGAGPTGLAGMPYESPMPVEGEGHSEGDTRLIRPILDLWREQTEACCQQAGLAPRQDASNFDLAFSRNRIRHQLLPELKEFNPAIKGALLRTGWLMRSVTGWMESEVDELWTEVVQAAEPEGLWIDSQPLASAPDALVMATLRRAHKRLSRHEHEIDFDHSQQALELFRHGRRGQSLSLPGGLKLEVVGPRLLLSRDTRSVLRGRAPQLAGSRELIVDGESDLGSGWSIQAQRVVAEAAMKEKIVAGQPPYDSPRLEAISSSAAEHLRLRRPQPGDEFQPLGMSGSMKLADFFINEGVPQAQREAWPLLVSGDEILWVVGLRLAEPAKVRPEDSTLINLELLSHD